MECGESSGFPWAPATATGKHAQDDAAAGGNPEGIGSGERQLFERATRPIAGGEGGTVTFGAGGRTAEVDGATTLLEAGEQVGVQMPFGCRMGICQSCVVPLVAGSVRDLRNGDVHVEGDRIQTCISAAAGDCVLGV